MRIRASLAAACVVALCAACFGSTSASAEKSGSSGKNKKEWKAGDVQKGKATWYGGKFHGGKTASGERYDKNSMTAAHRSLPFNTVVRVTNLKNDKTVTVRINNRGPFGKKVRIIDLSKAAAKKLKMLKAGVVPVKVKVLKVGDGKRKRKPKS